MDNLQKIAETFGVPVAVLLIVLYALSRFLLKHLWPFLQKQIDDKSLALSEQVKEERTSRKESFTEFMKALERRDIQAEKVADALDALTSRIQDQIRLKRED